MVVLGTNDEEPTLLTRQIPLGSDGRVTLTFERALYLARIESYDNNYSDCALRSSMIAQSIAIYHCNEKILIRNGRKQWKRGH